MEVAVSNISQKLEKKEGNTCFWIKLTSSTGDRKASLSPAVASGEGEERVPSFI